YELTIEVAKKLVAEGYGVITGGGPGIMEAGNKGAQLANGKSVGLDIDLPFEASHNDYIDSDKILKHRYFFVRKVMFVKYAQGFIFMPGGFGTLDELFECLTLIQTQKSTPVPIVLMGSDFWEGIIDWLKNTVLEKYHNISPKDLDLFKITDSPDEAMKIIREFNEVLSPNF
ncbi:MAG: TIGR00730 family Rossman fold protein, partial [Chitinophagales bacterium]